MSSRREFPNTFVIVSALILLSAVSTWVIPGAVPQTWQIFSALYNGFVAQAGIIVFILIVGGAFQVLNDTGAVSFGIKRFITRFGKYDRVFLVEVTILFSACGAIFGMSEETIPFVGIVVPVVISLGYDAVLGLLIVYVAAHLGFSAAFLNPFTVGIAQQMSDVPMFSGMGYRVVCWTFLTICLIVFVLVYAGKTKGKSANPPSLDGEGESGDIRGKAAVLIVFGLTIVALIVGATCFKWYLPEISALFLGFGILIGVVSRFSANRIADSFLAGAKDILGAALVVGLASGIMEILRDGGVIDLTFNSLQGTLTGGDGVGSISLMYGIVSVINLMLPSATAKAAIVIPVLAPFADMVGVSRQAMVMAFQFGDGFTNMITPTSGVLIAALGMAKIQYGKWFKTAWKWILALMFVGFILLLPTVLCEINGF